MRHDLQTARSNLSGKLDHAYLPAKDPTALMQKMDSMIHHLWNPDIDQFIPVGKDAFEYDDKGNNTIYTSLEWISGTGQWRNSWKTECTFTVHGHKLQVMDYEWNEGTSTWDNAYKSEYEYDPQGNILSYTDSYWDEGSENWIFTEMAEATYLNGLISAVVYYYWNDDSSIWEYDWKEQNTYDGSGNKIVVVEYTWDAVSSAWQEDVKITRDYDAGSNLLFETYYTYSDNQWVHDFAYEYQYDAAQQLVTELFLQWNGTGWFNSDKTVYAYSAGGNLMTVTEYTWDNDLLNFIPSYKEEQEYNDAYAHDELVLPWIFEFYDPGSTRFNHMLISSTSSIMAEEEWQPDYLLTMHYSEVNIDGISNPFHQGITVSPNPFSSAFTLSANEPILQVCLTDAAGRIILDPPWGNGTVADANDLPPGLYFCRVRTTGGTTTIKLIKQ